MSNDLTGNPLVIDTAASSVLVTRRLEILRMRWVAKSASAGDDLDVHDGDGVSRWASVASSSNYVESEGWHPDYPLVITGLIVPTIDSGTLYIYLRDKKPVT